MGTMYLAERSDEMFRLLVAIKLVTSTLDATRFKQEQEIIASLDHPDIAKLVDAGVTEEGWPIGVRTGSGSGAMC